MRPARRRTIAAALTAAGVVTVLVVSGAPGATQPGAQWAMAGFDLNNTRSNPAEQAISPDTVDELVTDWTVTTAGDVSATPAVVDGAVYFPDWGGQFWKVDAQTGEVIWSRSVPEYAGIADTFSRTGPAVVGDTVYIGTQSGALLLAIDTETGDLRWSTQMESHPAAVLTGSPLVYDGVVYQGVSSLEFLLAADPEYDCCTFRGSLVAVDAATGNVQWQSYTLPDQGPGSDIFSGASVWGSTPTVDPDSNTVFVGTGQNYSVPESARQCQDNGGTPEECLPPWNAKDAIIAMDLTTGEIKWSTGPPRFDAWNIGCVPGFPPNNCPNPGPDHDTSDGTHLFTIPGPDGLPRRAVGAGQKSGEFWMLDALTGEIIWSASVGPGSTLGGIEWGTANDGERIFFAESNNDRVEYQLPDGQTIDYTSFGALDAATGESIWQVPEPRGGIAVGPATTANGVVYFGALNGWMYAYDAATGDLLWELQGEGSSNAGPAIVDGRVFWGNGYERIDAPSTTFYAFGLPSGTPTSPPTTTPPPSPSPSPSPSPPPVSDCAVAYQANGWGGHPGFTTNVTITNSGGASINGWTLTWSYTAGQSVSAPGWSATVSQSGPTVTAVNAAYNATIPPGGSVNFGFNGTAASVGNNPAPTGFTLNGGTCTAG